MVVYEGLTRAPTPLYQEKAMCALGKYLNSTRRLNEVGVSLALAALSRYMKIAEICGVARRDIHPFATAAVRWADDGASFLAQAEAACGCKILVIDSVEEAELAGAGVLAGFLAPAGVVGDLGGSSLELVRLADRRFSEAVSLRIGGLSLSEQVAGGKAEAISIIDAALSPLGWLAERKGEIFYAIGGTWRTLAKLHMRQVDYPITAVHGYCLEPKRALHVTGRYANTAPAALKRMEGITPGREETLPFGALILNAIIRKMQPSSIVFSAFGVREGWLYRMMSEAERARDPLLSACEDVARRRARSPGNGKDLIAWTASLFQIPGPEETIRETRLREAACLLSDVGWRAHPDYRGEQSAALIAQSAFVGLDSRDRAFLALCVYHRHERKVSGELAPKLAELIRGRGEKRALLIGLAVRLAQAIAAGMAGVLPRTSLFYEEDALVLKLPSDLAMLDGAVLRRRLKALARELGMNADVRVAQDDGPARASRSGLFGTYLREKRG
jgi:exopolyphosphatase/guanosine-5'-triphosphate,3'-diphosphate pyrophosphatase